MFRNLSFLLFVTVLCALAGTSPSMAYTCDQNAKACMRKGDSQARCYGPAYDACQNTGTYVGPYTKKSFSATK